MQTMEISCSTNGTGGGRGAHSPAEISKEDRLKLDIYTKVLHGLQDHPDAQLPGFEDDLWKHFHRLPARYSIDFNLERPEMVLVHKWLLELAEDPENRPVFHVQLVQAPKLLQDEVSISFEDSDVHGTLPTPIFGGSSNPEAQISYSSEPHAEDGDTVSNGNFLYSRPMHEITFSSDDRPKLLNELTALLGELRLDIHEAHAFCTIDGYSLDVFIVKGWRYEETEQLEKELCEEIQKMKNKCVMKSELPPSIFFGAITSGGSQVEAKDSGGSKVEIPPEWQIDFKNLIFEKPIASGAYGDLYKGTYLSQDVAIKVLKPERVTTEMKKEFCQEVFIMRRLRHKNIVQLIGASSTPHFCFVTEYMSGGCVYDFLHKHKQKLELPAVLRVAHDVARGMNYLHQNNIIHRDLKTPNLLMDENQVVKVADFGVARVKAPSGVMTAETGTYRWMAPEVIEHKLYNHKADIFSFGIVLWELLTRKIPYDDYTPLQAAVGVVQKDLRPKIPNNTHPKLVELLKRCWEKDPQMRPDFSEIQKNLEDLAKEVKHHPQELPKQKASTGGIFHMLVNR